MQADNNNPLICGENADTIDRIDDYMTWLCGATAQDSDIEPGLVLALQTVRLAVQSLKRGG